MENWPGDLRDWERRHQTPARADARSGRKLLGVDSWN